MLMIKDSEDKVIKILNSPGNVSTIIFHACIIFTPVHTCTPLELNHLVFDCVEHPCLQSKQSLFITIAVTCHGFGLDCNNFLLYFLQVAMFCLLCVFYLMLGIVLIGLTCFLFVFPHRYV